MAYRVDVFDQAGTRQAILQDDILSTANLDMSKYAAPVLTISIPANDAKAAYISPLYNIKIYNTQTSSYEFSLFKLYQPDVKDSPSGLRIKAKYQGVLTRLSKEFIDDYDSGSGGDTLTNIVTALLAYQINTPAITVGTIEPTDTVALAVESGDIYSALTKLRDAYGGWFEVDSDLKLNWYNDNSGTPARQIRRSKNLKAIQYTPKYSDIVNRVYAYGNGESTARLNLTDAGEANEYIQDATSISTYGTQARKYIDKSITHPTTLLAYAQRILATYKDPVYQYSIDIVNLAEVDGYTYTLESLGLDTRVRIIDDLLSVDVNTSIVAYSINLKAPEQITVDLSSVKNDLSDLFGEVLNVQDIASSVATQIGAGQVTVLGAFTVIDWVSGGTTKIVGDYLTTGTISAATISLDTSGGDGEGIIKSSNYSAGSTGWSINGDGDAEFNNVTVRGTLAACSIGSGQTLTVNGGMVIQGLSSEITFVGANPSIAFRASPLATGTVFLGSAVFRMLNDSYNETFGIGRATGDVGISGGKMEFFSAAGGSTLTAKIDAPTGYITANRYYFDSNHYMYLSGNDLYWYNGSTSTKLN